MRRLPLATLL
jgi:hypothetical protein